VATEELVLMDLRSSKAKFIKKIRYDMTVYEFYPTP